jgi:vgrG protein
MDKTTVEEAAYAVSKEWASAAVPKNKSTYKGKFISNGYMSYYAGDGMNNAHYSADVTINALKETKKIIDNFGGYSLVREVTLSILNK